MLTHLWRFVRAYVSPYAGWFLVGTAAVLATNWLSVQVPAWLAVGLDALRAGGVGPDGRSVLDAAGHIGVYGVLIIVVRSLSRLLFFTPARRVEYDLREDLFAHCLRLQPAALSRFPTGDLLARTTSDVTYARAFAGFGLLQVVNVVAALTMALGQMIATSPVLTGFTVAPILLGYLAVQYGANRLFALQRVAQSQVSAFSDELLGAITGVGTVQAFCVEDVFIHRLDDRADAMRRVNVTLARLRAVVFPLLTVAGGLSIFLLIAVGGPMAVEGSLSVGGLAAFIALVGYLLFPLRMLGVLLPVFQRSEASLERIYAVLDTPVERPERERGATPVPFAGRGPAVSLRGLTFAYPDAPDRPVLADVTVDIPAGASIGIFGRTGSGKTTLLRLLSRLRNPPRGAVLLDGVDVLDLDLDELRRHLVYVPQTPFLFGETIRENVGFGAPAERVEEAVGLAALGPDLAALPEGLDTVVGERGIVLSGGQRQRVTLARGLAREGEIVLLDDVLSAVDHHTEQELIGMLERRASSATRILVSHRMSALERCDLVLVLDGGRLVDQGRHAELLERDGPYRDAWEAQRAQPEEEAS